MDVGVTGIRWVDVLIIIAAALTALGVIWTKALRPIVRGARVLEQVVPTLVDIGREFHENGGHTLKASLLRIEKQLTTQGNDLATLYRYAHDTRHEQAGHIEALGLFDQVITRQVADLAAHLAPVPAKLDAIADAAATADTAAVEHREAHPEQQGE